MGARGEEANRNTNVSRPASGAQNPRLHPERIARPRGPGHEATPEDRPPRAVGCARPSLVSSLGRGKPPRQLTALGGLPGRLTRRLFTSFHSATLRSATRSGAPPPRRRSSQERRHCPQAPSAMPPYDSAALHFVKTGETGENPGQRITSPSFGNALKFAGLHCGLVMRWPPSQPHLWPPGLRAWPTACPVTLKPRPGAEPGRPEVRERVPPRPNGSAPDCQLSARDRTVLKSWQTGA